jgi:anaerobic magnesium-protoporphyrin IX monomethyl ester cyclase
VADVLLAHSFFLRNDPKQVEKMRPYAPLATLYAAAMLRQGGYDVALFDAMLAAGEEELAAALDLHRPRFVALYEDSFNFLTKMCLGHAREAACRMTRLARERGITKPKAGSTGGYLLPPQGSGRESEFLRQKSRRLLCSGRVSARRSA